ncbi:MAG: Salicylate 1-monooxygenase [Ramlibacter sp.]|nr:Salicylate 1-monooxygenase [Ramlibacter sp.]
MSSNSKVAIVGAGLGGLTCALALLRDGVDVDVFEQAGALGDVGAGLQLSANANRCLFSLGLEPAMSRVAVVPEGKQVRLWQTGETRKLFDLGQQSVQEYGFPYLMLHRADLHAVLAQAAREIKASALRLGERCVGISQDDTSARVQLESGLSPGYDLVIGADGVHSRVRAALGHSDSPAFTGCVAWRGLIPTRQLPERMRARVGTNWIGPGAHVVTYPVRGGELLNFVGIVERSDWLTESWNTPGTRAECAADFAGWHEDVRLMIDNIGQPYKWALMSRQPLQSWSSGRVTLLGDACHPTLPFLAQGAAMAIEDGIVLAGALKANPDDIGAAVALYERCRIERTSRIVQGAISAGRRFHNPELADVERARAYVEREWSEDKVRNTYQWLFEYNALEACNVEHRP